MYACMKNIRTSQVHQSRITMCRYFTDSNEDSKQTQCYQPGKCSNNEQESSTHLPPHHTVPAVMDEILRERLVAVDSSVLTPDVDGTGTSSTTCAGLAVAVSVVGAEEVVSILESWHADDFSMFSISPSVYE